MVQPFRIVATADTHGHHRRKEWSVPDGDMFIHAGDLTPLGSRAEVTEVLAWIASLPHRHKIFIAGNHDFLFEDDPNVAAALVKEHDITYLLDSEVTVDGLRIWGSPWQPRFFDWAFNLDRGADIDQKWQQIPSGIDVLVTHGPPFGMGDRARDGRRVGCEDLARHLERTQPRVHLFGHIHEDPGEWHLGRTRVINCSASDCRRDAVVVDL